MAYLIFTPANLANQIHLVNDQLHVIADSNISIETCPVHSRTSQAALLVHVHAMLRAWITCSTSCDMYKH